MTELKTTLTNKMGPGKFKLPLWGWGVVGVAGYLMYRRFGTSSLTSGSNIGTGSVVYPDYSSDYPGYIGDNSTYPPPNIGPTAGPPAPDGSGDGTGTGKTKKPCSSGYTRGPLGGCLKICSAGFVRGPNGGCVPEKTPKPGNKGGVPSRKHKVIKSTARVHGLPGNRAVRSNASNGNPRVASTPIATHPHADNGIPHSHPTVTKTIPRNAVRRPIGSAVNMPPKVGIHANTLKRSR